MKSLIVSLVPALREEELAVMHTVTLDTKKPKDWVCKELFHFVETRLLVGRNDVDRKTVDVCVERLFHLFAVLVFYLIPAKSFTIIHKTMHVDLVLPVTSDGQQQHLACHFDAAWEPVADQTADEVANPVSQKG